MQRRLPKHGFTNRRFKIRFNNVNLGRVQEWIDAGRLDPSAPITIKHLKDSGCVTGTIKHGVKLLSDGCENVKTKNLNIEVTRVSEQAKEAVAARGGAVSVVYMNPLNLRAHLKPHKFDIIPRLARPPPRLARFYPDTPQPQPKPAFAKKRK